MSFLSDVLPVWKAIEGENHTSQTDPQLQAAVRPSEPREQQKSTWIEVKLPSIPIQLSESPPVSRAKSRSIGLMAASQNVGNKSLEPNCLFCGNHSCKANSKNTPTCTGEQTVILGQGKRKKSNSKALKAAKMESVETSKLGVFGTLEATKRSYSPRSSIGTNQQVSRFESLSPRETKTGGDLMEGGTGWQPFSCVCQYCGLKFGKHSVAIHEERCKKRRQSHSPNNSRKCLVKVQNSTNLRQNDHGNTGLQKVATIITMGLGENGRGMEKTTIYADLPPRPQTRTLQHSTLGSSGYGIPLANTDGTFQETDSSIQCEQCEQIITADRISVHRRLCKPKLPKVSAGNVVFPTTCDLLRVKDRAACKDKPPAKRRSKPPTKVCYICGREFGSISIDIHEPQCMKKWQTENRKLPIGERKRIPRKLENKPTIARALSRGPSGIIDRLPDNVYDDDGKIDEIVQGYYQKCYSEFEMDLVPCKKCGRKFAPERHRQHEQNCNAKPLVKY